MAKPPSTVGPFQSVHTGRGRKGHGGTGGGSIPPPPTPPPPAWERGCESHEHPSFSDLYGTEGKSDTNQTPAPSRSPEPQYA